MSLTKKTVYIILSILVPLFLILYIISDFTIYNSYETLEREDVARNLLRAEDAIDAKLLNLESTAEDWSSWDDTFRYTQGLYPEFIQLNMMDHTFTITQWNLIMVFDKTGQPLFTKAYDLVNGQEVPVPRELIESKFKENILKVVQAGNRQSGLILTSNDPLLIVTEPVLDSFGNGPPAGVFVAGIFLSSQLVSGFSETTHLSLAVERFNNPDSPADFKAVEQLLSTPAGDVIKPMEQNRIGGYHALQDIYGDPFLILRVDLARDIHSKAVATVALFHIILLLTCIIFFIIFIVILKRMVLSRVIVLDGTVQAITKTGDKSKRLAVAGKDELSRLSSNINSMLDSLELADRKIVTLYEQEKKQREELEKEAQARSQFIDVLAHELRTPLTPIIVSVELVREMLLKAPESIQYKLINNAYSGADSLRSRLEELLDLARYERGAFKLNIQIIETGDFLETTAARYKPALDQKYQQLQVEIQKDLPQILADPSRLEQVLVNLLSNASKYSPENSTITLRASVEDENLLVEIKDHGIGVPPEEQNQLFMPYHRAQQDRQSYPGIGLGLAVCSQIIQAHGGKIWLESERGKGSSFKFTLPINGVNLK
jgi:signal transduction histidine kinase